MKRHKVINIFHCPTCYDKVVEKARNSSIMSPRIFVGSKREVELYKELTKAKRD